MFLFTWYIYRECLINLKYMWSIHFIINFEIILVNFINILGFLLLASKKNKGFTFLICYLLVITIYCFFNDHGTWLLLLEYFRWFVQVSAIFERLVSCFFVVSISHTRKYSKKHTHYHVFFEKSWAKFFLKPFVFAIQF